MKKKLLALSVLAAVSSQSNAFQVMSNDDWDIRWDNTFKGGMTFRTSKIDKDVVTDRRGAGWALADDSDFSKDRSNLGIASARIDVLSEMDIIWRDDFGFRISGSAWYDAAYESNDHPSNRQLSWASTSVDVGEYSDEAEDMHYLGGEILDAFVFANFDIGDMAIGARAGRHTIYWGNGLLTFGAIHGFGGAMAPIDFNKALSVPGSEAKELFMPTAKISTVLQLTDNLTVNAYYNMEHQAWRLPETGTFWSPAEGLSEKTDFITLVPGQPGIAPPFRTGSKGEGYEQDDGDWGINFQYFIESWGLETSVMYLNYVDKNLNGLIGGQDLGAFSGIIGGTFGVEPLATLYNTWGALCGALGIDCPPTQAELFDPRNGYYDPAKGTMTVGAGKWAFKNDIELYGLSFAKEMAGISFGMDIAYRKDAGLAPELAASLQRFTNVPAAVTALAGIPELDYEGADSDDYYAPVGDIWSVVINGLGLLQDNGFWEGGSYIVEATFSMLDDCTEYCDLLDVRVSEDRVVSTIQAVFNPTWYQVVPGWDLTVPMSISYVIDGEKSPVSFGGDEESGTFSIGGELLINQAWTFRAQYNERFGPVKAGIGGLLKDRDNISLTIKRTF
jgi:hypothetical protein